MLKRIIAWLQAPPRHVHDWKREEAFYYRGTWEGFHCACGETKIKMPDNPDNNFANLLIKWQRGKVRDLAIVWRGDKVSLEFQHIDTPPQKAPAPVTKKKKTPEYLKLVK